MINILVTYFLSIDNTESNKILDKKKRLGPMMTKKRFKDVVDQEVPCIPTNIPPCASYIITLEPTNRYFELYKYLPFSVVENKNLLTDGYLWTTPCTSKTKGSYAFKRTKSTCLGSQICRNNKCSYFT